MSKAERDIAAKMSSGAIYMLGELIWRDDISLEFICEHTENIRFSGAFV